MLCRKFTTFLDHLCRIRSHNQIQSSIDYALDKPVLIPRTNKLITFESIEITFET